MYLTGGNTLPCRPGFFAAAGPVPSFHFLFFVYNEPKKDLTNSAFFSPRHEGEFHQYSSQDTPPIIFMSAEQEMRQNDLQKGIEPMTLPPQ